MCNEKVARTLSEVAVVAVGPEWLLSGVLSGVCVVGRRGCWLDWCLGGHGGIEGVVVSTVRLRGLVHRGKGSFGIRNRCDGRRSASIEWGE